MTEHTEMTSDAFDFIDRAQLEPGVWPKSPDLLPRHFQLIGLNRRALVVGDMGGLIEVAGVHVTDPDHLEEMASRLAALAGVLRRRQNGAVEP
jgi:hypothetical protein